jgi:sulfhydrogenase subunit delta
MNLPEKKINKKMKQKQQNKKLKVGFYAITGCQGCQLSVIFNEDELLDLIELVDVKSFPFIKEKNQEKNLDMIVIEGVVTSMDDAEELKRVCKHSKIVVATGACATTGGIPAFRNFLDERNFKHLRFHKRMDISDMDPEPIDKFVKVDYYLQGCPPDKEEIKRFFKNILLGKKFRNTENPVCYECRMNGNKCKLDQEIMCLGPITQGGCNAVCVNGNLECWGCRGPIKDANAGQLMKKLEEIGVPYEKVKRRLETFVGMKTPVVEEGRKRG